MKSWKSFLSLAFTFLLLTGCVTTRYTDPNLTITPEFKEVKGKGKTMQIVIEDPENIYFSTTKGLMSDSRGGNSRDYFLTLFKKYFDWEIRDISTLKKVEFYTEEDTRKYDYTLYLSYIGFYPYYVTTPVKAGFSPTGITLSAAVGKAAITDVKFNYDLIYRLEDNATGEIVMFSWVEHESNGVDGAFLFNPSFTDNGIFVTDNSMNLALIERVDVGEYEENSIFWGFNWLRRLTNNSEDRVNREKVSEKIYKFDKNDVIKKKEWKKAIKKLSKDVILNTPFYSKEKEEEAENKFYDFNKKSNF